MPDKAQRSQKPAHKIRHRALSVTIWKNSSDKGTWYSVTPSRAYKQGEEWKESDRFDSDVPAEHEHYNYSYRWFLIYV